jgi:hydroxymethylglutaryl-CoA lyase
LPALAEVIRLVDGRTPINVSLSCCFGCPMEGDVALAEVLHWGQIVLPIWACAV